MKIAMMTRWNVPSGQSSHAEPVGRAWLEMGHDVKVLAPAGMEYLMLYGDDEPFVRRCYMMDVWNERLRPDYFFDPRPFLEGDYEVFVVEDAEIMPMPELLGIFPEIKKKAKTVLVVHEVGLPDAPNWYKFDWDAIVCFDVRYKEFMAKAFPEDRIAVIPFPCHPPQQGDRAEARKLLDLPPGGKVLFAYGYDTPFYYADLFPVMERVNVDYPLIFLLLTHHTAHGVELVGKVPDFFVLKEEMPKEDELYTYLHASDVYVYYGRDRIPGVGVASSVAACLGAGRPVVVPGYCNFFDLSGKEVIRYNNLDELELRLREAFEEAESVKESLAAAREYAARNSSHQVAAQFIDLFRKLQSSR